ncbi:hypothetical protein Tco_0097206 [Tanacetum coccineum]
MLVFLCPRTAPMLEVASTRTLVQRIRHTLQEKTNGVSFQANEFRTGNFREVLNECRRQIGVFTPFQHLFLNGLGTVEKVSPLTEKSSMNTPSFFSIISWKIAIIQSLERARRHCIAKRHATKGKCSVDGMLKVVFLALLGQLGLKVSRETIEETVVFISGYVSRAFDP